MYEKKYQKIEISSEKSRALFLAFWVVMAATVLLCLLQARNKQTPVAPVSTKSVPVMKTNRPENWKRQQRKETTTLTNGPVRVNFAPKLEIK